MTLLQNRIRSVLGEIPVDDGGGCSVAKASVMAHLILRYRINKSVDIGVYRGRSFFPQALAHQIKGHGCAYAVDPWSADDFRENETPGLQPVIDQLLRDTNFDQLYAAVETRRQQMGLASFSTIRRERSEAAANYFRNEGIQLGLVHVDGNHDADPVLNDVTLFEPLVEPGGFIVMDDVSWESVRPAMSRLSERMTLIATISESALGDDFAVFWKVPPHFQAIRIHDLRRKIRGWIAEGRRPVETSNAQPSTQHETTLHRLARQAWHLRIYPGHWAHMVYTYLRTLGKKTRVAIPQIIRRLRTPRPDPARFVIFDDAFPCLLTSFRVAEFNSYLQQFPQTHVYTSGRAFPALDKNLQYDDFLAQYAERYPAYASRISRFDPWVNCRGRAAYLVFVQNAQYYLRTIERHRLPFAFTLYPGGAFRLNHAESDEALRHICGSRYFRKVITTQPITTEYLLQKGFCAANKIETVFGVVMPADALKVSADNRRLMHRDKNTFDICFVAFKYMPGGIDKGYDTFLAAARLLANDMPEARFHVVGPFTASDGDITDLHDRLHFYGSQPTAFFPSFYAGMDAIVSPNVPFLLFPGSFDGFPTGACTEAGLSGVAVFCTDILKQNRYFEEGRELVIVDPDARDVAQKLLHYGQHYDELRAIADRGRAAFHRIYSLEAQMGPRIRIIEQLLREG